MLEPGGGGRQSPIPTGPPPMSSTLHRRTAPDQRRSAAPSLTHAQRSRGPDIDAARPVRSPRVARDSAGGWESRPGRGAPSPDGRSTHAAGDGHGVREVRNPPTARSPVRRRRSGGASTFVPRPGRARSRGRRVAAHCLPSGLSPSVPESHRVNRPPAAVGSRTVTAGSEFHRPRSARTLGASLPRRVPASIRVARHREWAGRTERGWRSPARPKPSIGIVPDRVPGAPDRPSAGKRWACGPSPQRITW